MANDKATWKGARKRKEIPHRARAVSRAQPNGAVSLPPPLRAGLRPRAGRAATQPTVGVGAAPPMQVGLRLSDRKRPASQSNIDGSLQEDLVASRRPRRGRASEQPMAAGAAAEAVASPSVAVPEQQGIRAALRPRPGRALENQVVNGPAASPEQQGVRAGRPPRRGRAPEQEPQEGAAPRNLTANQVAQLLLCARGLGQQNAPGAAAPQGRRAAPVPNPGSVGEDEVVIINRRSRRAGYRLIVVPTHGLIRRVRRGDRLRSRSRARVVRFCFEGAEAQPVIAQVAAQLNIPIPQIAQQEPAPQAPVPNPYHVAVGAAGMRNIEQNEAIPRQPPALQALAQVIGELIAIRRVAIERNAARRRQRPAGQQLPRRAREARVPNPNNAALGAGAQQNAPAAGMRAGNQPQPAPRLAAHIPPWEIDHQYGAAPRRLLVLRRPRPNPQERAPPEQERNRPVRMRAMINADDRRNRRIRFIVQVDNRPQREREQNPVRPPPPERQLPSALVRSSRSRPSGRRYYLRTNPQFVRSTSGCHSTESPAPLIKKPSRDAFWLVFLMPDGADISNIAVAG